MADEVSKVRVERRTTSSKLLPRSWWNSEQVRMQDLTEAKVLLDQQERAWNGMVAYWHRGPWEQEAPPPSPPPRKLGPTEVIKRFP